MSGSQKRVTQWFELVIKHYLLVKLANRQVRDKEKKGTQKLAN